MVCSFKHNSSPPSYIKVSYSPPTPNPTHMTSNPVHENMTSNPVHENEPCLISHLIPSVVLFSGRVFLDSQSTCSGHIFLLFMLAEHSLASVGSPGLCCASLDVSQGVITRKFGQHITTPLVSSHALVFLSWQVGMVWTVLSAVPVAHGVLAVI